MTATYYADNHVTLYLGDCREITEWLSGNVLVTDPPYGIAYRSGHEGALPRFIAGDTDTTLRDYALALWGSRPALVFGTWRAERPEGTHTRLIWDTKGALGMGNLSVPWKPSDQEIYVLGHGFTGPRTSTSSPARRFRPWPRTAGCTPMRNQSHCWPATNFWGNAHPESSSTRSLVPDPHS